MSYITVYKQNKDLLIEIGKICPSYNRVRNPIKKQIIDGDLMIWASNNLSPMISIDNLSNKQRNEIIEIIKEGLAFDDLSQKPEPGIEQLYDGYITKKRKHSGQAGRGGMTETVDRFYDDFHDSLKDDDSYQELNQDENESLPLDNLFYEEQTKIIDKQARLPYFEETLFEALKNGKNSSKKIDNNYEENGKRILLKRTAIRYIWNKIIH